MVKRREFITLLGGAAAWPIAARAQHRFPRALFSILVDLLAACGLDDQTKTRAGCTALAGLQQFGWAVGRNLRIDLRWAAGEVDRYRQYAAELVALAPD